MTADSIKAKLVRTLLDRGILVSESILEQIDKYGPEYVLASIESNKKTYLYEPLIENQPIELKTVKTSSSAAKPDIISGNLKINSAVADEERKVRIVSSYNEPPSKKCVEDFVNYFNKRYEAIRGLLMARPDLINLTSINKVLAKKDKDTTSIIGIVVEKTLTKAKNILLKMEDPTGQISVVVNKTKQEMFEQAKNIVEDEIIGINGFNDEKVIFCNKIIWPDIPLNKELKKSPIEEYALFLSDIHVGSVDFLEEKFVKFLKWLSGEIGTDQQQDLVKKIKYVFIVGDLVDGVGVYPNQEEELLIKDIYNQYGRFAEFIAMIPKYMTIIICAGNHDAVRLSEPQPIIDEEFIKSTLQFPNVVFISNPGIVNIAADENFSGFDVLMYHGYCFDYYISNVDSIRNNGGYDRADLVMKFLLERRHLAPTHASTIYNPDPERDPLVISRVPDFFVTGHIHKTSIANYRNVTLISGSCWQSTTPFQEKVGHKPEPARVPIVNLQTREAKILRF